MCQKRMNNQKMMSASIANRRVSSVRRCRSTMRVRTPAYSRCVTLTANRIRTARENASSSTNHEWALITLIPCWAGVFLPGPSFFCVAGSSCRNMLQPKLSRHPLLCELSSTFPECGLLIHFADTLKSRLSICLYCRSRLLGFWGRIFLWHGRLIMLLSRHRSWRRRAPRCSLHKLP